MSIRRNIGVLCLAILLVVGLSAVAQQTSQQNNTSTQQGLVNVDISNVKADIAKNINVDVSQVPVNVQVPIDVAANVCGVAVNALTSQVQQGNATCTAKSTSSALNSAVQNQIKTTTQK
jgi:hypothetical protein